MSQVGKDSTSARKVALLTMIGDAVGRARLSALLRDMTGVPCCCSTLAEMRSQLWSGGFQVVILSARDRDDLPTIPLVLELRKTFPEIAVLAYWTAGQNSSAEIVDLIKAGAHQLIIGGVDEEREILRSAVIRAAQSAVADSVLEAVRRRVLPSVWPIMEFFLKRPVHAPTIEHTARVLGVDRKTLLNRLRASGYPAPGELRAWCRLLMVAQLLEHPGRSLESIAAQLGFSSAAALGHMLKRYTGLSSTHLRGAGALNSLLDRFMQQSHGPRGIGKRSKSSKVAEPSCGAADIDTGN